MSGGQALWDVWFDSRGRVVLVAKLRFRQVFIHRSLILGGELYNLVNIMVISVKAVWSSGTKQDVLLIKDVLGKEMSLKEYEKVLQEKIKALVFVKSGEPKGTDKDKKKDVADKEEKANKLYVVLREAESEDLGKFQAKADFGFSLDNGLAPSKVLHQSTYDRHHPVRHQGITEEPTHEDSPTNHDVLHRPLNPVTGEPSSAQSSSGNVNSAEPN
ncbi:hypothetical protein Tco_1165129 [Tanacetum coccineum]